MDWFGDEDYYLWIRLTLAGKHMANLGDTLSYVRVGEEMYRLRHGWVINILRIKELL